MNNVERTIVQEILEAGGLKASKSGLRFDRVVVRLLGDLRDFTRQEAPPELTLLLAVSAPIRVPAKTASELKDVFTGLFQQGSQKDDTVATIQGNRVRIRCVRQAVRREHRLIGFVHNPEVAPKPLLDVTEQWLHATR